MLNFHTLDVFTDLPYSGNPLAVVLDADNLTTTQMQTIAREFNLSETIFVQQPDDPTHTAKVRIFFPTAEIPFAGHPTIGCAILLAELAHSGDFDTKITLEEVAGLVPVKVQRKSGKISAEFTAPVIPHAMDVALPDDTAFAKALNLSPADIGFGGHSCGIWQGGPSFMYVPLNSMDALQKATVLEPQWSQICTSVGCNSVYLYCATASGFQARMFAPGDGVPEDPATGSASAILAAQLLQSGSLQDGENRFSLVQGVEMGRPSQISLMVDLSGGAITAVRISGTAIRVGHGTITTLPLETG